MIKTTDMPEWANWVAKDRNGAVYVYVDKPYFVGNNWSSHGTYSKVANINLKTPWAKSLQKLITLPKDVLENYNWIAKDKNGEVWAFDEKPEIDFCFGSWDNDQSERFNKLLKGLSLDVCWEDSLLEIHKTKSKVEKEQKTMQRPNTVEDKYNWIAKDSSYDVYAFVEKPERGAGTWGYNIKNKLVNVEIPGNWKNSLRKMVSEEKEVTYATIKNVVVCVINCQQKTVVGTAVCCPADKFDFDIGKKLAYERALEKI